MNISRLLDFIRDDEDKEPSFILLTRNIVMFVIAVNLLLIPLVTGIVGEGSKNITALITLSITLFLELISIVALR